MKITIDAVTLDAVSPEVEAALARLNLESNGNTDTPADEFALSVVTDYLDSLVGKAREADLKIVSEKLYLLTDAEIAVIKSK